MGQQERLIYEKVAGLKKVNVGLSVLYNFSSEGAFSESQVPVVLVGARPEEVRMQNVQEVYSNVKAQVRLDQIRWLAECVAYEGCPQCSTR